MPTTDDAIGTPHSTVGCTTVCFQGHLIDVFQQAAAWAGDPRNNTGNVFAVQLEKLGSNTGFAHDAEVLELMIVSINDDEPPHPT